MKARLRSCGRSGLRRSSKILGQHCCAERYIPAALVIRRARLGLLNSLSGTRRLAPEFDQLLHHMRRGPHMRTRSSYALDYDLLSFRQIKRLFPPDQCRRSAGNGYRCRPDGLRRKGVFGSAAKEPQPCFRRRKLRSAKGNIQRLPSSVFTFTLRDRYLPPCLCTMSCTEAAYAGTHPSSVTLTSAIK
jgi:hypothetical protein